MFYFVLRLKHNHLEYIQILIILIYKQHINNIYYLLFIIYYLLLLTIINLIYLFIINLPYLLLLT